MDTRVSSLLPAGLGEFLANTGLLTASHGKRRLLDHLLGTAALLKLWKDPAELCAAGLCHSVYGTRYYHHRSVVYCQRGELRATIGSSAERLVYLYSAISHEELLAGDIAASMPSLHEDVPTTAEFDLLRELSFANFCDQMPDALDCRGAADILKQLKSFQGVEFSLSSGAREILAELGRIPDAG